MNIIVDKPQLVKAVKLYLTKSFGDLTPKTNSKYPGSVFYVNSDNEILMQYNDENKVIWIGYDQIWSKLESLFYLEFDNIQLIMKDWLEEHYGLRGAIPFDYWKEF
jgi:hypothetical protein